MNTLTTFLIGGTLFTIFWKFINTIVIFNNCDNNDLCIITCTQRLVDQPKIIYERTNFFVSNWFLFFNCR